MEKYSISGECELTEEVYKEYTKNTDKRIIIYIILILILPYLVYKGLELLFILICVVVILALKIKEKRLYKIMKLQNENKIIKQKIEINNDVIIVINKDDNNKKEYKISDVSKIIETKNLIIFLLYKNKLGIIIEKSKLQGITAEKFRTIKKEHMPQIKYINKQKHFSLLKGIKTLLIIMIFLVVLQLVISFIKFTDIKNKFTSAGYQLDMIGIAMYGPIYKISSINEEFKDVDVNLYVFTNISSASQYNEKWKTTLRQWERNYGNVWGNVILRDNMVMYLLTQSYDFEYEEVEDLEKFFTNK